MTLFETPSDWLLFAYVVVMGACFGSFANVVIYRLPAGLSVVRPGSYCWSCNTPIKLRHNLPILGWFLLRGRCANCKTKYSFRYPAVEILMATLFGFAYYQIGWNWFLLEALIFIFGLVTVSFIDLDHMILPDKFTLPGIVIGLVGALLNPEREFLSSLYGVLLGGGFLWAIAYLYALLRKREGMGGGDIKLLAWIGAVLGWKSVPFVILVASIFGSVVGVGAMLFSKVSKTDAASKVESEEPFAIPFGPFLATAALIYLLFDGEKAIAWYLELHKL
ncbi:MAG: A24 family peptidase [Bdellovibrionales bacterium]|nr:A24 family peptidase [Bdellovibrionales bacterium]